MQKIFSKICLNSKNMCSILVFAYFFLLGIILGLLYDLFKIFRILIAKNSFIFFMDILYFVICSLVTFALCIFINSGIIRGFIFQGEFLGFIIYKYIFSRIILKFMQKILFGIKIVRFIKSPKLFIFDNNRPK
ncbi:MAG: spore cortex biosynthesis protein YabQ [Clostridia bacterium]|nr:spore cortex biosynthesis protein YabQ [Clostridia bacterium]